MGVSHKKSVSWRGGKENKYLGVKLIILVSIIFCHIVDDYYLQGWLASAKQKSWWEKNAPDKLYRYDYIVALFMHSFSWSFMIMLVPTVYVVLFGGTWYPLLFIGNFDSYVRG